ncbi:hypothetical protein Tco_1106810 [Tanacetum coccineum]
MTRWQSSGTNGYVYFTLINEDEREPMFVHAHDLDYVSEPIYPEYIPLEDDHKFPAKEQPLPPVDSPTAESLGYVTESDPEEDQRSTGLIDRSYAALPSPPTTTTTPSLLITTPFDRRDDIPESEQPPRKRLYLSTLGSRYEVGESSTARPTRGDSMDGGGGGLCFPRGLGSLNRIELGDSSGASDLS